MVLFKDLILGTPTCDSWSRVYVDGFVLRLDTRNFYVWFLVLGICRWSRSETGIRDLYVRLSWSVHSPMVLFWGRWCRIIWSPLGSSSGSLDFGFWILDLGFEFGFPMKLITNRSSRSGDWFSVDTQSSVVRFGELGLCHVASYGHVKRESTQGSVM